MCKLVIQDLWSVISGWDAALLKELQETHYYTTLEQLQQSQIPRWVQLQEAFSSELQWIPRGI